MKTLKIILFTISILFLIGCETREEEGDIIFDNKDFTYIGITGDDYLLYRNGTDDLEVKVDEENYLIASYEKGEDIYLILGEEDSYLIRLNGSLVITCSGEPIVCSGQEQVDFREDIGILFAIYDEPEISITKIIIGALLAMLSISVFFIPRYILKLIKISNIKDIHLFMYRVLTILIFVIGITIIILSISQ